MICVLYGRIYGTQLINRPQPCSVAGSARLLSIEELPLGLRELGVGQLPLLVELRQLLDPGRQRVRGCLLGGEFMARDMASVGSNHAQHCCDQCSDGSSRDLTG